MFPILSFLVSLFRNIYRGVRLTQLGKNTY